jgi:hypothetical protein
MFAGSVVCKSFRKHLPSHALGQLKAFEEASLCSRLPMQDLAFGWLSICTRTGEGQDAENLSDIGWMTLAETHGRNPASAMIGQFLTEMAAKYTSTKFLKIISTDCIPNYPDSNLPTIFLYYEGNLLQHLNGLASLGGPRTSPERKFNMTPCN